MLNPSLIPIKFDYLNPIVMTSLPTIPAHGRNLFSYAICCIAVLILGSASVAQGQEVKTRTSLACGTASPSPEEFQTMGQQFLQYARIRGLHRTEANTLTYVPVRVVIFRRTNATVAVSELDVLRGIMQTNQRFRSINLQFYVCGGINYFTNDTHFDMDQANEATVASLAGQVSGVVNLYFPNSVVAGGNSIGGYAYLPNGFNSPERMFVVGNQAADGKTTPHEMGHYFSLLHTFQNANNATIAERELVTRVAGNCSTKGDQLCGTPADPFGRTGGDTYTNCTYSGGLTDANGATFTADASNIMGYMFNCGNTFTGDQSTRMENSWINQADRRYTSTGRGVATGCGSPTLAASPTLNAPTCNTSGLSLSWTNVAGNAGYFIERSADAGTTFGTVGAVVANTTSFTDAEATANTAYIYRIKPANSNANFSNSASVTTCLIYCTPTYAQPCYVSGGATMGMNSFTTTGATTNITNTNSGCSANAYGDFSAISGTFAAGATINYSISFNIGGCFPQSHAVWIDFNNNGTFEGSAPGVGSEMVAQDNVTGCTRAGSFTIPATAAAGTVRMRIRSDGWNPSVTSPCARLTFGEVEDYTVVITNTTTWNGAAWSPAAPSAGANAVLAANYPNGVAGQGAFTCNNLTVNTGTTLTIASGQTVTANGALAYAGATIEVLTGGSFVQSTTSTSISSNTASRFRAVRTDGKNATGYNFISSPVGGETMNSIGTNTFANSRFRYSPVPVGGIHWVPMAGTDVLATGRGYTFIPGTGGTNTLTFENTTDGVVGQPGNGNLNVPLTFTGDNFNLVGNPYPSPLRLQAFLAANAGVTTGTAWIWNDNNNATGTGTYTAHNSVTPAIQVAVGQGFFVLASGAGNAVFTNALRASGNPTFFRGEGNMERFLLRVNAADGTSDQLWTAFGNQFTQGFENGFDAEKLEGATALSLAAVVAGGPLAIAALPNPEPGSRFELPLAVFARQAGALTFAASEVENPTAQKLFLEDRQSGEFYYLQPGRNHTLNLSAGHHRDRFYLRSASEVAGQSVQVGETAGAFAFGRDLFVEAAETAEVAVYSILGTLVQRFANVPSGGLRRLAAQVPNSGVYVVKVATATGSVEKRVWLEK